MKIKAIISSLLVMFHMVIMVWYYSHDEHWQALNPAAASFWYFGIAGVILGLNMIISASNRYTPIQIEIYKLHGVFVLSLGTIYSLHYSGILISNNNEKYFMIITAIFIAVLIVLISAWRHGHFRKDA